ncbi:alpha/beta hydrolase [Paenibacillus sp. N1-5-1-14]|uniref:alpha/beta hydrolase n=1 Tax=Paenibacillus radicibacter TaxID=2972488 RepID=UPI0021598698|nr:alpha/beta hydrolase [Paenibacillus radicibacter]MCR8644329.1 alpha/beta hydrolase [Paenibacillus radicibacter]
MTKLTMPASTKLFLADIAKFPPLHTMIPEELRKVVVANAISDNFQLASVKDYNLEGPHGEFKVRLYRPTEESNLPVLVFFHGGGFVFNRIEHYDPMCSKLATATGCVVASVDYHLAPEYKFPVPVDEALFATKWVSEQASELRIDPNRIVVAGESVGGNLAAIVAQHAGLDGVPSIACQILICPLMDWNGIYESRQTYASGYFLDQALLDYCADHYFELNTNRANPLVSPIYGKVDGVAPALIITAEFDPLRDEGEAYGKLLSDQGIKVSSKRYDGMIHLFYALTDVFEEGHDVYDLIRDELRELH